ncbi:MAG: iron-containing alcohol dehydrogenase [Porticoccaceae bacterium]
MLNISTFFYRLYHYGLKLLISFLPPPSPILFKGDNVYEDLIDHIQSYKLNRLLLVTDKQIYTLGLHRELSDQLARHSITLELYSDVEPNNPIDNIEQALNHYQQTQCQGIICLGGGSVMDCGKLVGARIARPDKTALQLKGLFKIRRKLAPIYAVPTTAGTGSETTVAAVVFDPVAKQKFAVTDLCLCPKAAVLIPKLTYDLPPQITANSGMDALTHAIEAYIGIIGTNFTHQKSMDACGLIFANLLPAYQLGQNHQYRENMLLASFYAGEAFTRASVGYVHAIAHSLGGRYGTAHGLANAIILPKVLRWYGPSVQDKLATLANHCQIGVDKTSSATKALAFIEAIEALNHQMGIPTDIVDLKPQDIPMLAKQALKEAHPDYPVPKFMDLPSCEQLLEDLLVTQ